MTLRLIFVRHGLSSFNKEGRIQGRNDLSTLTREGQLQAEAAGKTISSIPIDAIYSSPLQRASETTKIIIKQHQSELQATYTDELLEVDLGPWSGLTKNEIINKSNDVINPKIIVVPILKKVDETIAGIISKKQNGLNIPPVKYNKVLNCNKS